MREKARRIRRQQAGTVFPAPLELRKLAHQRLDSNQEL